MACPKSGTDQKCNAYENFQSHFLSHFPKYRDQMLSKDFAIRPDLKLESKQIIQDFKAKHTSQFNVTVDYTVGIHVRRKDIRSLLRKKGGLFMSKWYYRSGMDYFRKNAQIFGKTPMFIVASDEPQWSIKYLSASDAYFTANLRKSVSPQLDMAILGKSKYKPLF